MTAWTEGYVADIPYSLGFYRETLPSHLAFAAICVGRHPGGALAPKRVLELGFGMGLGFVINAASNPTTHFEGVDFNPLHVAHARGLVEAAELTNVTVREASFQDLAREASEGQHDVDLIVLHGILTWVSTDAHEAIVEIARKRLKPGGLLYVSYNCMPGWAPVLPMQRLMRENAKRIGGRSDIQTSSGMDLVKTLIGESASYFAANPQLGPRIEKMAGLDAHYLAHEYLNANWHIFHFADVAEMFGRAKLTYLTSATLAENMDNVAVPERMKARIAGESDPVFKETLRDFAANKQFRRDLFSRGSLPLTAAESFSLIDAVRFSLAVPRSRVTFKFPGPLGEITGNAPVYGAVADLLADHICTFGEIASLPVFAQSGRGGALEAIALFVHSGQALPIIQDHEPDLAAGRRLNSVLIAKMLRGRTYNFLAAPAAASGIQATHGELLMYSAILAGHGSDPSAIRSHVVTAMQRVGVHWAKDGKALTDPAERDAAIEDEAVIFLAEKLPIWQRLGIL